MTLAIILGLLLVLLLTGAPIFAALGLASLIITLLTEGHVHSIADTVFAKLNNNLLTAIPMFAFMAFIMIRSRVVDHLYEAANAMVRHLPGGLGIATVSRPRRLDDPFGLYGEDLRNLVRVERWMKPPRTPLRNVREHHLVEAAATPDRRNRDALFSHA